MAYAMLAGVAPIYGLYAGFIPLIIYAFMGSTRQMSIGPVAVSTLVIFAGVSQITEAGTEYYLMLILTAGFYIGVVQFFLGVFRFGFLVNFLSRPVIAGLTSAAAIIIAVSQFKDILGIGIPRLDTFHSLLYGLRHLDQAHLITFLVWLISLIIMIVSKRIKRTFPAAIVIVLIGTALTGIFRWDQSGLEIIGTVPSGLPGFRVPDFSFSTLNILMPTIWAVAIIGIVESMSIAKMLESKHPEDPIDTNQELKAIGMAKVIGGFFQAIPSSGSFSRSAINNEAGAKTQVSSLVTALIMALALLVITPLFYYMPRAILAAIIVNAVIGLFDYQEAINLWKTHRMDLLMMAVTFFITLFWGIGEGVATGVVLSLFMVLYQSSRPHISILGKVPGTTYYRNLDRFEDVESIDDTLILRFEDMIYFGNAGFFKDQIRAYLKRSKIPIKHLVLDATSIHTIDSSGIHALGELDQELKSQDIDLHLCGARGVVRDILYKSGLMTEEDKHHMSIDSAIQFIHQNQIVEEEHRALQRNSKRR